MLIACLAFAAILAGFAQAAEQEVWVGTAPFCKGSPDDCRRLGMDYVRSDSRGDGSKCFSGKKVLCRRRPEAPSTVGGNLATRWVGTAPFCQGHPVDCALMDFDYVRSDKSGAGKPCVTGTKVLCRARHVPCDERAFLTGHLPPLTKSERSWGEITDAMKKAGIGGSWQHLGSSRITGCILQAATSNGYLGDKWQTIDVKIQTVCGRPVTDTRYIRIEVLPKTRVYQTALRANANDIISTGGEFGYDWPHRVLGRPLREIRPATDFSITGRTASKCQ